MASLDELAGRIASQESIEAKVALLVSELAQRIKATSNDQNIQKLSRDLEALQPELVRAIAGKAVALHSP